MRLKPLDYQLTICKVATLEDLDLWGGLVFVGKSEGELSLVCETARVPDVTLAREDGWRALRVEGTLDFSLTGILARIASVLAEEGIPVFAESTFDTDYLLTREADFDRALRALAAAGYEIV